MNLMKFFYTEIFQIYSTSAKLFHYKQTIYGIARLIYVYWKDGVLL